MAIVVYLLVMKNVSWGSGRGGTISAVPSPCTVIGWTDGPCVASDPCSQNGTKIQTAKFYNPNAQCTTQTQTASCNNAPGCKPPQSAWVWDPSSWQSATTVWMSATQWTPSPWPTYNGKTLALKSFDGTWCLTFLTSTNQLCMWKKSGTTYTPQWWTHPGSTTSLPSFGSDGSISCSGLPWNWKPSSTKKGPFTLMIGGAGSIDVRDSGSTIVSMTPAWPTSGTY